MLTNVQPCEKDWTIKIIDGFLVKVVGIGSITLSKGLTLKSVLLVPNLDCSLLSISKLTDDLDCVVNFSKDVCEFQDRTLGKTIGSTEACSRLYILNFRE